MHSVFLFLKGKVDVSCTGVWEMSSVGGGGVDWDKHVRHLRKRIEFDEFYQQKKSVLLKTKNDCNQL